MGSASARMRPCVTAIRREEMEAQLTQRAKKLAKGECPIGLHFGG